MSTTAQPKRDAPAVTGRSKADRWLIAEPPWLQWRLLTLENEDGVMPKEQSPGKPPTRRYSPREKADDVVRMVRALRTELGTEHGTVQRVAKQLGYGVESVRLWVKKAHIDDGRVPGVSATEAARVRELEQRSGS